MNLSMNESVTAPDTVLFRDLDGEAVVLNMDSEMYYGLDDVAVGMWKQLTTQPTIQDAYNALLAEYEVEPDVLQAELERLVAELVAIGLLELSSD